MNTYIESLLKDVKRMREEPKKKISKMLTREGHRQLANEFNELKNVVRPKVVDGVATAAAEGDRSENAEYIYGKKRLREIDKRLGYLTNLLKDVKVVDPATLSGDRVCFGSTVKLRGDDGLEKTFQLVGVGEAYPNLGSISWQSPVGLALHGKKVGDFVIVKTPQGEMELEVIEISFV